MLNEFYHHTVTRVSNWFSS